MTNWTEANQSDFHLHDKIAPKNDTVYSRKL